MKVERINSGIPGLDRLINGGIPRGNIVLVSGEAGAGKTTFCSQFLWKGLKKGENCMFVTFEEPASQIKEEAALFGWDFDKYEDEGKLILENMDPFEATGTEELFWFEDELKSRDVDRLALDSTSTISLYHDDPYKVRKGLYEIIKSIKDIGVTAILTAESPGKGQITRYEVIQYIVDGVIMLYFTGAGDKGYRSVQVRKMRKTDISTDMAPFEITDKGILLQESMM